MAQGLGRRIEHLINCLRVLPGVGPRSAQRIALDLLEHQPERAAALAAALQDALAVVVRCECCQNLTEQPVCSLCADAERDDTLLCVVESPLDVIALEQSGAYGGRYFVLRGRLSPLDGRGPQEIGLPRLERRLAEGRVSELILATSSTVEGEATGEFVAQMARQRGVTVTRLAQGIPLGGELGGVDRHTLGHALSGRKVY